MDEYYMSLAIELAKKGMGFVNPNPLVGAVIVKNGKVISQGYHKKYGDSHGERMAIDSASISLNGATLYVTLEPCCHYGKQPPCTQAIVNSGIKRVVIGSLDCNPIVNGKGITALMQNGINVTKGVLKAECDRLNEVFFHYIKHKTPYVVFKYAATLDGKISTVTGKSKWITCEKARQRVHQDRLRYSAIMVGLGTVLTDDPLLTCRLEGGRNPIRIICDTNLNTPLKANIVKTAKEIPTTIATACKDIKKQQAYTSFGCEIMQVSKYKEHINLDELMIKLGSKGIDSILLEGGSELSWSALESGIVNKVHAYIAPKIFGGVKAKTPVGGYGFENPKDAVLLKDLKLEMIGEDILIEGLVQKKCLQE